MNKSSKAILQAVNPAILLPVGSLVNEQISRDTGLYVANAEDENITRRIFTDSELKRQRVNLPKPNLFLNSALGKDLDASSKHFQHAVSEGCRSANLPFNLHTLPMSFFGLELNWSQEFVENLKGIGAYGHCAFCETKPGFISRSKTSYNRPFGGQSLAEANHSTEISSELIRLNKAVDLGIAFAPTVYAIRIPELVSKNIVVKHPNGVYKKRIDYSKDFTDEYGIEMRLMPSQVRFNEFQNYEFLQESLKGEIFENLILAFRRFIEVVPKTTKRVEDKTEWFVFGINGRSIELEKDMVISKIPFYVDLESAKYLRLPDFENRIIQSKYLFNACSTFSNALIHLSPEISANKLVARIADEMSKSEFVSVSKTESTIGFEILIPALNYHLTSGFHF